MYVAVKGGRHAIDTAHAWLAEERRGDPAVPELALDQIAGQMTLAVARVMAEGALYDPSLAALALKQARGDTVEAVFLLRAFRTTLPRLGASRPVDTAAMACDRRISATFKDLPGGQVLGPTFDYTHRLLDFALAAAGAPPPEAPAGVPQDTAPPRVLDLLRREGLIEPADPSASNGPPAPCAAGSGAPASGALEEGREGNGTPAEPPDLTRAPLAFPAERALRLQALARADEGFLLGLAYSTQRGYARNHAFVGELRLGTVAVEVEIPELGFAVEIGEIALTECETVNQFRGSATMPAQFTRGYGLVFGACERKALAMALVDRALRWEELGEQETGAPAHDAEFVLAHADNVQSTGFLEHIKLPHYVDFQAELELVRRLRRTAGATAEGER